MSVALAVEIVSRMELRSCPVNDSENGVMPVVLWTCVCRHNAGAARIIYSRTGDPICTDEVVWRLTCCIVPSALWKRCGSDGNAFRSKYGAEDVESL